MPNTEIGERLAALLHESPVYRGNAKALSLDAGLGETAVRDIIEGRSQKPRNDTLQAIVGRLNKSLDDLVNPNQTVSVKPYVGGEAAPAPRRVARGRDLIPIKSAGRGGNEQEMFLQVVGHTLRPTVLEGVREAYAVYMIGDSMEPRYEQGWLLHVNPFKPPTRGRDVVIYKTNNAVLIKRFVNKTGTIVTLEQLNPPEKITIPAADVREMHLIVGADQEGG